MHSSAYIVPTGSFDLSPHCAIIDLVHYRGGQETLELFSLSKGDYLLHDQGDIHYSVHA